MCWKLVEILRQTSHTSQSRWRRVSQHTSRGTRSLSWRRAHSLWISRESFSRFRHLWILTISQSRLAITTSHRCRWGKTDSSRYNQRRVWRVLAILQQFSTTVWFRWVGRQSRASRLRVVPTVSLITPASRTISTAATPLVVLATLVIPIAITRTWTLMWMLTQLRIAVVTGVG
jgi:hypothetical protein